MPMVRRQWRINPLTDIAANVNLEKLLFDFISWKCFVTFLHKLMFHGIDILLVIFVGTYNLQFELTETLTESNTF